MYSYRLPAIAGLAGQLKRGPRRLRLRQLMGIEFLLSVVEVGKSYPFEFVRHGLTGYRSSRNGREDEVLGGEALRIDLVNLAEDLSADADIATANWPEPTHTVAQLAERFDVSTKTIFRWHRRGMVGWRMRFADHRVRLAFPERCVRRFVAANLDLVSRGSAFSQLSADEREAIIRQARELVTTDGDTTINALARQLAGVSGRAVETIRLILKEYDDAHPNAGICNRNRMAVAIDDDRLKVWEAHCDGASVQALAERFGKSVAWVYRAITQMRAAELKSRAVEFVPSDEFLAANADEIVHKDPHLLSPTVANEGVTRVPRDLPPYLQQLFRTPLLTAEGERALFRKMNYLRFCAERKRQEIEVETATAKALDEVEALLDAAVEVKNQITRANLRLVVSIAKKHISPQNDFFELVSDGNVSLMRAVEKFDYSRGFKFSTYASWAIMKNFARSIPDQHVRRERFQTGRDELLEHFAGPSLEEREDDRLPALRRRIDGMLDALDEREQTILRARYGLEGEGEPQTLEQIGRRFGVSKERIRQLEARAMDKLRTDFAAESLVMLDG